MNEATKVSVALARYRAAHGKDEAYRLEKEARRAAADGETRELAARLDAILRKEQAENGSQHPKAGPDTTEEILAAIGMMLARMEQ